MCEASAGTLHLEDHEHVIRSLLRPPPQTPESCRSAPAASTATPSTPASTATPLSDIPATRQSVTQSGSHFVSHFSYDDLIAKLTLLSRTFALIARRLLAVSASAADELSECDVRVSLVDCHGTEQVSVVRVYDAFDVLHRRLQKLLPSQLHGWLRIGLLPALSERCDDADIVDPTHASIQPLPTHCLHASVRQLLQHACNTRFPVSSPLPTLRLGCYADVEVWAANTLTQPPHFFRLQNVRVVGDRTLGEHFSSAVSQQLYNRFSLTTQPTWKWFRATRVLGIGGQPLDMDKAVELDSGVRVLSCQLDQPDAVLVASLTALPASSDTRAVSEVQLLVQRLAGDHITLSFDANETVASLKRCLHSSFHVPLDEQELFFQQQPLDDDSLVGECVRAESDARIALLLSSPQPVLVSSVFYNPITYYTHRAVHDVRELMLMRVPARREVRQWAVAQCVEWLEVSRGRMGRVWAALQGRAMKGVSSTGVAWLPDEEEEALWQQTRDTHIRMLDAVDVTSHAAANTAPLAGQRASSAAVVWSHECDAEEDGVPRVEHIDLDDDDDSALDGPRGRPPPHKRSRSAPAVSPSKVLKRRRRMQRRRAAAVVDLRETGVDSESEEREVKRGKARREEGSVVEILSSPETGSRSNATHRQLSFTIVE